MAKTNLQIRIPENLVIQIEKVSQKSKSAFVREAIEEKVRSEIHAQLEEKWIKALKKDRQDLTEAEDWLRAESWDTK